jgi:excisionase family DNA binding protein
MRRLYDVVTVAEAAKIKGVSEEAVRKRIGRKVLAAEKVGGTYLIRKAALDAWTVQRKKKPGEAAEAESERESEG